MSTPDAPARRRSPRAGRPRAWAITSSSSERPVENESARAHSPPIVRAATSITAARPSCTRTSAWTGPSTRPRAAVAAAVAATDGGQVVGCRGGSASRRWSPRRPARRGGRACRTRPGPAARRRRQSLHRHLRSRGRTARRAAGLRGRPPAAVAMRRTRSATATASSAVSARSTPWLARQGGGLDHARNARPPPPPGDLLGPGVGGQRGEGRLGHLDGGQPRPHGELVACRGHGVGGVVPQAQSWADASAATTVPWSSTAITASRGATSSWATMTRPPPAGIVEGDLAATAAPMRSCSAWASSVPITTSTPEGPGGLQEISRPVRRRGDEEE